MKFRLLLLNGSDWSQRESTLCIKDTAWFWHKSPVRQSSHCLQILARMYDDETDGSIKLLLIELKHSIKLKKLMPRSAVLFAMFQVTCVYLLSSLRSGLVEL